MSWEKEWGKVLFNNEGIEEFKNFLDNNNITIKGTKITDNLTISENTIHWLTEGNNAVKEAHDNDFHKIFWKWITTDYKFKDNEICVINLIDQKLKKTPHKKEVKMSTLFFNSEKSEELRYRTIDLYEDNSYLF